MANHTLRQNIEQVQNYLKQVEQLSERIKKLERILARFQGALQQNFTVSVDNVPLQVSETDRYYRATPKKEYRLAVTFLRRGIQEEIDGLRAEYKALLQKIKDFDLTEGL